MSGRVDGGMSSEDAHAEYLERLRKIRASILPSDIGEFDKDAFTKKWRESRQKLEHLLRKEGMSPAVFTELQTQLEFIKIAYSAAGYPYGKTDIGRQKWINEQVTVMA